MKKQEKHDRENYIYALDLSICKQPWNNSWNAWKTKLLTIYFIVDIWNCKGVEIWNCRVTCLRLHESNDRSFNMTMQIPEKFVFRLCR